MAIAPGKISSGFAVAPKLAVVQAKLHQLHRHKGQLFSGMAASRHQFCVQNFGATEANSSLMAEVSSTLSLLQALNKIRIRIKSLSLIWESVYRPSTSHAHEPRRTGLHMLALVNNTAQKLHI